MLYQIELHNIDEIVSDIVESLSFSKLYIFVK